MVNTPYTPAEAQDTLPFITTPTEARKAIIEQIKLLVGGPFATDDAAREWGKARITAIRAIEGGFLPGQDDEALVEMVEHMRQMSKTARKYRLPSEDCDDLLRYADAVASRICRVASVGDAEWRR